MDPCSPVLCPLTGNKKGGWPTLDPGSLLSVVTPVDSSVCFLLSRRPPESTSYPEARVALINWWDQPRRWRMLLVHKRWSRNETIFRSSGRDYPARNWFLFSFPDRKSGKLSDLFHSIFKKIIENGSGIRNNFKSSPKSFYFLTRVKNKISIK